MDKPNKRMMLLNDILCYGHVRKSSLFLIEEMTIKPTKIQKSELNEQIEKKLLPNDYNYERQSNLTTAVIFNFMKLINKSESKIKL